jgi:hypothetical protein
MWRRELMSTIVKDAGPDHVSMNGILANTHAPRADDAVELAAALKIRRRHEDAGSGPVTLISADQPLNAAAIAEGLPVDAPNSHL